jgi:hypothetical protein
VAAPAPRLRRSSAPAKVPITAAISGGRFGNFRFIEQVERAGPAELYHALWSAAPTAEQRVCLLKRLRPELVSSPAFVRMFGDEARVMAQLDHPNVVRVYEHGVLEGLPYMATEPLDGLHLSQLLLALRASGKKLPIEVASYVAQAVAAALAHAHEAVDARGEPLGIVHGDVRPQNVMLLATGGVKLVEFGVAKIHSFVSHHVNAAGAGPGKPCYLSPEQILGAPLDARSDLFSLGVLLWELLVGRPLFPPAEPGAAAQRLLGAPIDRPSSLRVEVPTALDNLVMRLLERELPRRYPRAAALVRDLAALIPAPHDASRAVASMVRTGLDASAVLMSAVPGAAGGRKVTQVAPNVAALLSRRGLKELAIRLPGSLRKATSMIPVVASKLRKLTGGGVPAVIDDGAHGEGPAAGAGGALLRRLRGLLRAGLNPWRSTRRRAFALRAAVVALVAFAGGASWHELGDRGLPPLMAAAPAPQAPFPAGVVIEQLPARGPAEATPGAPPPAATVTDRRETAAPAPVRATTKRTPRSRRAR